MITVTHQPFFQPIFDLESTRLTFGRVVLLGDFAFVGAVADCQGAWDGGAFGSPAEEGLRRLGLARASQIPTHVIAAH
jgi:hypothetical protein